MKYSVLDAAIFFKHVGQKLIGLSALYVDDDLHVRICEYSKLWGKPTKCSHARFETGSKKRLLVYRSIGTRMVTFLKKAILI